MSLGATIAWTSCTNWAGVWILRQTLVCLTVLSAFPLPLWAVVLLLRASVCLFVSFWSKALLRKCKGMREYVRKLPLSPLTRETKVVLECRALYIVSGLGKFALLASDCSGIDWLVPIPSVEDRVWVLMFVLTPVLKNFRVLVLLDLALSSVFCGVLCGGHSLRLYMATRSLSE